MYVGYEMSDQHRQIIAKNRVYLLHNMHPSELLWSSLISKEVLSMEMVDEIKCCTSTTEKLGLLLDMLPIRGPKAFDDFIEVLLECDHCHVAEYLKTKEATEKFRSEIDPHCNQVSDNLTEKFVKIFKKNTPAMQRFAERKFELFMAEQAKDIKSKEEEVKGLEDNNTRLQLENTHLRGLMNKCYNVSETITTEIKRETLSKTSLREESKNIDNLKTKLQHGLDSEDMFKFYENMQQFLSFLEKYTHAKSQDRQKEEKITNVHDVLKKTMKQKRKLEDAVLAMQLNFREIRRLDTECREKQAHVNDLQKQVHIAKKKGIAHYRRQSWKLSEQRQQNLEKKKSQLKEIENDLNTNIHSVDKNLNALFNLIPDREDANNNEFLRSDTETTYSHIGSTLGSPPNGSVRTDSVILENDTYCKLAQNMGNHNHDQNHNHENTDNNHDHQGIHGLHGRKMNFDESENRDKSQNRKQIPENSKQRNRNFNFLQHNRNAIQRGKCQAAKKSDRNPESLSKEDIDKWLLEQENNEHLKSLHKTAVSRSMALGLKEHKCSRDHDTSMDAIQESARSIVKEAKSDSSQSPNQNADADKEKSCFETKPCVTFKKRINQPPPAARMDNNANVAIESETTGLATSSRAARKSHTSLKKERELEQRNMRGRETLSTKAVAITILDRNMFRL